MVHGLGIGTDRNATWVFVLTLACALAVVAVATWRVVVAAKVSTQ